jgi:hypothetical protein
LKKLLGYPICVQNLSLLKKLLSLIKIKTDFKKEQYLYANVDKKSLSNFIKIRVSNCNLNIEKGRYLKLAVRTEDLSIVFSFELLF